MVDTPERLFFDEHQWATVEAATARIIPTDHDPGAREAGVARFIDRYLSSLDYVYANAWGSGFLRLSGRQADAWGARMSRLRARYVEGLRELDRIGESLHGKVFHQLDEDQQDEVLVVISGRSKPRRTALGADDPDDNSAETGGPAVLISQPVTDERLDFFATLILHTRMGFYGDPAYGGNIDRVGWATIGFPGPASLAETHGHFSTAEYLESWDWARGTAPDETS